ncbi:MAG: hypothetical protein ACKO4Y_05885 [Flavobacteriales bacterium]
MVLKRLILLMLLIASHAISAQTTDNSKSIQVDILFAQDLDHPNLYQLTSNTNSNALFGTINFYGANGRILLQLQGIEIPHAPGYHGIDISEFPEAEEITIEMIIEDVSYTKKVRL